VGHAGDRQQAPRARLPQAGRLEPYGGARRRWPACRRAALTPRQAVTLVSVAQSVSR
jgi:hypothetical protein